MARETVAPEASPATGAHRRPHRSVAAWDLVTLALLASAMLGVHLSGVLTEGTEMGRSDLLEGAATTWIALTAVATLVLLVRDRPGPRALAAHLAGPFRDPPGDWTAFVVGTALAIPMLGMHTQVLFSDADSARIVAAVTHVQDHGIGFLQDTHDNVLPHLIFGPAIASQGLAGAKIMAILSVITFAGAIAYIARRATGSMAAAVAAALSLLALGPVVDRGAALPLYCTMLSLGYGGGWLAYRALTDDRARVACGVGAGVCLALAPEAQPVGVLFLPVPVLLLIFARGWRPAARMLAVVYGTVAVASLPRLALNLSEGGTERLASYRTDYWITEGYLGEIQQQFWNYLGVSEPLGEYLDKLPGRFVDSLGVYGWVVLAAAGVAWLFSSGRARIFALAALGYFVLAISVKQVPPFARYYSPLWPGIALLVGGGAAALARRRTAVPRIAVVAGVVALAVMAGATIQQRIDVFDGRREAVYDQPYSDLVGLIDDDKGVIGARSHALLNVTADIPTWGGQFLTEDEYVTYLTWPSDAEVVAMMREHDIGWVFIHANRILETNYHNTWLIPHHRQRARHVERILLSPEFCAVATDEGYALFRLGPCTAAP